MRIALFGGSFDPIHNGHVQMAQAFVRALALDRVIFMPTGDPPHKMRSGMAAADHRLAMCRLAVQAFPWAVVSDRELSRGGASFTVDTLRTLREQEPEAEWFLLTGADMFVTLHSWYRFSEIARMATLCTLPRDERNAAELQKYAERLTGDGARCVVLPEPVQAVSSTGLRERARRSDSLSGLVPPAVEDYIHRYRLYRSEETMEVKPLEEQYKDLLRPRLSEKRYAHSLAVADRAEHLAPIYGADPKLARTAGLLHDIMKDTLPNEQLQIQKEFGILMDTVTQASPALWHAVTGAAFLEHVLMLPPPVVRAVRFHTTGCAGMTPLDKTVYLADFTSADREYPDVETMRRLSEQSADPAMLYALRYTIGDLTRKTCAVHPDTLNAYNELLCHR